MATQDPGEQQEIRLPGQPNSRRYQIKQKMLAVGNDFWIENEQGETVYKVDGKAMRLRRTLHFEDAGGKRLATIQKVPLTLKETMQITNPGGEQRAVIKKDLITPLKEHFVVEVKEGPEMDIRGNILDHEYQITKGSTAVAEVSKKFLHVRDSYSVSIASGQDDVLLLALVVCIDAMTHKGN